jgi:polyprenyl P-hydroxybenzoate/phenylacrylic acid decarboxylase-like protein
MSRPRLVVAITGSSAPHLGVRLLQELRAMGQIETHAILSNSALRTIELEMAIDPTEVTALADVVHAPDDFAASVASGSFETLGTVVIPCSMGTLGAIASGTTPNLVARVADVALKERRRLVLVTRETPLSLIHIRNMETVTLAGATVLPPVPAFYHGPESIDDLLGHIVGKVLDQFAITHDLFRRWS